ncbi:MAG: nuclear transport factor 2 family protein [Bacteroidota bacterium]
MKILLFLFATLATINTNSELPPNNDQTAAVIEAVQTFAASADQRNIEQMDVIMHSNFRAIVNRLFGSEEVSIMDKALYLDLLAQGKIGGDEREVTIVSIHFEGHNALVKATLEGKKLRFTTFMQLVQASSGAWKVISDMPNIEEK